MKDSDRIQKLAAKLAGRKDGLEIVRKMKCGGKKYPGGGKFFRTNLQQESPLMYQPMVDINYPIETPLRFRPEPDLGDYRAPESTGMVVNYPVPAPREVVVEVPAAGYGVSLPVESSVSILDPRKDAARRIMAVENSKASASGGWDAKTGRWYPHKSIEGGADTIAYGIKLSNGTPEAALALKQGYLTDEQAVSAVDSLVQKYYDAAKRVYDGKYGAGEWDKLSDKSQSILVDYSYNPGLAKFPKLMEGFHSGNLDLIRKNYKRYSGGKELGRNKFLLEELDTLENEYPIFRADGGRLYANGGDKKQRRLAKLIARLADKRTNGLISAEDVNTILAHPTDYMKHLYSEDELDEMRKRLYSEYYPMGYFNREGIPAASDIMQGKESKGEAKMYRTTMRGAISQNNSGSERMRDAYFAQWLGIPEEDRRYPGVLVPSSYTPSIGYLGNYPVLSISSKAFPDKDNQIVDSYWAAKQLSNSDSTPEYLMPEKGKGENYVVDPHTFLLKDNLQNSEKEWEKWLDDKSGVWHNTKGPELLANGLAAFTVGSGVDPQRGQYISMFDKWDINPFDKNGNVGGGLTARISKVAGIPQNFDATGGIGNPFYIYDRVYLDDYYGVNSKPQNSDELYGGYILPSIVTAEKKDTGGKIHIKPENRGKFTALKNRTGHSASWFKAHGTPAQKKMAVFALNARKWKHGDGGFINKYDGETESTGLMQRTPNWVVRGQDYSEWKPSDIQDIIDWGYTDPEAFFGQEGQSTRDALSRAGMADSVIGDIYRNAPAELQAQLGDRYMGTAQRQDEYNQGIRDYTNYVAPRLGAAMAGSLLGAEGLSVAAPWLVDVAAPAIQRAANSTIGRRIRGGLDVVGTIDGIRNSLSDNGLRKTYRLLGEGNYGRAALSALGDVFDVAGGVGYLKGVGKRGAEAILRMGDAARSSGSLLREALGDANYLGKTGLKKYAHVPKYIKSQRDKWGHTSRQLLDRSTLEYIFNPMANPELAYKMPYNYSGDNTDAWQKGRHKYDRIDEFLGKTQPENVEYVNVEDLPANIREWAEDRYPGMKQIRVAHIGKTTDRVSHIDREIRGMKPGDTIENLRRSSTGLPDEAGIDMLDPGHHGVDLVADENGTIRAFGNDVYKYNEKDWLKKWKNDFDGKVKKDGEVDKPKTFLQEYLDKEYGEGYSDMSPLGRLKYHGLRFIDRQGSPIIYNWDYGTIGHVPSYNMNPSTYVPSGAPDIDSTIAEIDDWIAKKKKAMMFTSDIDELDALSKDVKHGEMLKKMKEPVTPTSPYENYWADSDLDDVDFDIPDMSTFKSPEVDSEIGTFTDWMEADAAKEAAKEAAAQKHLDALDKLNDTSWINLDEINNPKPKATQAKKAVKKMTDEEVKALQDEITKQVKETYEKMKASKAKKTSSYNPAPHSNGTNPEDAELPWAYGGLLNRMSKFYNNDRSSMLNLVRKVKAGKN